MSSFFISHALTPFVLLPYLLLCFAIGFLDEKRKVINDFSPNRKNKKKMVDETRTIFK